MRTHDLGKLVGIVMAVASECVITFCEARVVINGASAHAVRFQLGVSRRKGLPSGRTALRLGRTAGMGSVEQLKVPAIVVYPPVGQGPELPVWKRGWSINCPLFPIVHHSHADYISSSKVKWLAVIFICNRMLKTLLFSTNWIRNINLNYQRTCKKKFNVYLSKGVI